MGNVLREIWIAEYVADVTAEKPRAICYIDDRAVNLIVGHKL